MIASPFESVNFNNRGCRQGGCRRCTGGCSLGVGAGGCTCTPYLFQYWGRATSSMNLKVLYATMMHSITFLTNPLVLMHASISTSGGFKEGGGELRGHGPTLLFTVPRDIC